MKDELPGICISPDEEDITRVTAIIIGPKYTPYEGGLFHFELKFPPDYPFSSPTVQLMTTDGGRVRFNPNLYADGKVCLSILGTWSGPGWQPSQSLASVLLSVQSLMNDTPYHNEPGFESELHEGDVRRYNDRVIHETLRVAVCDSLEQPTVESEVLQQYTAHQFLHHFDYYLRVATQRLDLFDGRSFEDPFNEMHGTYQYSNLVGRLHRIQARLIEKYPQSGKPLEVPASAEEELCCVQEDSEEELEELEL